MSCNASTSLWASEEEVTGWAFVTNQLALDNARRAVTEVEEPAARANIVAKWLDGLNALINAHAASVSFSLRRAVTTEVRRENVRNTEKVDKLRLHMLEISCQKIVKSSQEELDLLRVEREAEERRLELTRKQIQRAVGLFREQFGIDLHAHGGWDETSAGAQALLDGLTAYVNTVKLTQTRLQNQIETLRKQLEGTAQHRIQPHSQQDTDLPAFTRSWYGRALVSSDSSSSGVSRGVMPRVRMDVQMDQLQPVVKPNDDISSPQSENLSTGCLSNAANLWKERKRLLEAELHRLQCGSDI